MTDILKLKGTTKSNPKAVRQHQAMAQGYEVNTGPKYPNTMSKTTKTAGVCIPK